MISRVEDQATEAIVRARAGATFPMWRACAVTLLKACLLVICFGVATSGCWWGRREPRHDDRRGREWHRD